MARMKWVVRMVLVAGTVAASGCASSDHGFNKSKVREWAMQGEHMRQLHRVVTEVWNTEAQEQQGPTDRPLTSVGIW